MTKIKDIKFTAKKYKYLKPFHITNSITYEANNVDVEIITSNGIIGRGEASPSWRVCGENVDTVMALREKVGSIILGKDIKRYYLIFEELTSFSFTPSIRAAVEFAIIDAFCQELGIRVADFLGGVKRKIEIDKTVSIGSIDERVKDAVKIKNEGFNVIKIKVGENIYEDIETMEEIYHKTKGLKYIVDANTGYSPKEAVFFAKKLYSKGIDISVYEQPVEKYNVDALRYVRFNSPYPVAADESVKTKYDAMNVIKKEAVDFINIKLMKTGFFDAISIVEISRSAGIKLMIGCMSESTLGINQSVQLACGKGCFDFCDLDSHLLIDEKENRGRFGQNKNIINLE